MRWTEDRTIWYFWRQLRAWKFISFLVKPQHGSAGIWFLEMLWLSRNFKACNLQLLAFDGYLICLWKRSLVAGISGWFTYHNDHALLQTIILWIFFVWHGMSIRCRLSDRFFRIVNFALIICVVAIKILLVFLQHFLYLLLILVVVVNLFLFILSWILHQVQNKQSGRSVESFEQICMLFQSLKTLVLFHSIQLIFYLWFLFFWGF